MDWVGFGRDRGRFVDEGGWWVVWICGILGIMGDSWGWGDREDKRDLGDCGDLVINGLRDRGVEGLRD